MKKNPINAQVNCPPGQRLPKDWAESTANFGGTFDRRNLAELWKTPQWTKAMPVENLAQAARLSNA